jgi:predicted glycosyltransferase
MNCMVYCQHVLGIGHLCRILLILRKLKQFEITLILGGTPLQMELPDNIHLVQLPGLCMDENFSGLQPVTPGEDVEEIKTARTLRLLEIFENLEPELLLVELFPFGRNAFRFELLPLLKKARNHSRCNIACSVRDILVERDNTKKFEQRVIDRLHTFFDLVLIHGDPDLVRLDETFSRLNEIRVPLAYTGYICQPPLPGDREKIRSRLKMTDREQLIVVSAGSGSVGASLLQAACRAFTFLPRADRCRMQIFTGPYIEDSLFEHMSARTHDQLVLKKFTSDFPAWLAAADLSVSMGGYNTTMNIVRARCRALVLPFDQNHEQRMRAQRLEQRGCLQTLAKEDLEPQQLAEKIHSALQKAPGRCEIMLNGAEHAARLLTQLVHKEELP